MGQPLVTVIITTYNRTDKIEEAIKSVLKQTYKNIELIVVDDNKEGTKQREETETIIKKYPSIKYIKNEKNLGGALSRNVGINAAKGEFIAFLDDDDTFIEEKIEKQYNCYLSHKNENVGLIYCYTYRENPQKKIIGAYENNYEGKPIYEHMMGCIAATSLWFCPKKVLIEVGQFEDTPCKQDSILLLKILANDYSVYRVPEHLAYYYEHNGKGISGTGEKNIIGLKKYRDWCRKYYSKLNDKQINDIECNFSLQLITLYIINNMKKNAKTELKNIIKRKLLSKETIKALTKIYFSNLYLKKLGVK